MEKNLEKTIYCMYIFIHTCINIIESLYCTTKTNTILQFNYTLVKILKKKKELLKMCPCPAEHSYMKPKFDFCTISRHSYPYILASIHRERSET